MARPSFTWLTTDTHWYHDKIKEACGRPDDYNEFIVKHLRYLVAPQDLTVHLGDVIFYKMEKLKELLAKWPGRKVLVLGNHDKKSAGWYMRNGFDFACN